MRLPIKERMKTMKMTVFAQLYNEEYLLPWWLMHHTKIFDHGILLNKGSTDRSVEICKQLAPHWEIRESAYGSVFSTINTDEEIMSLEQEVDGWKIALNITEFLCMADPQQFYESLDHLGYRAYFINGFIMVDYPNNENSIPVYDLPLVKQRYHGFGHEKLRLIHSYENGSYTPGRHDSNHSYGIYPSTGCVLKYSYSPWNESLIKRKLQIGPTQPESDRDPQAGLGWHHQVTREQLEQNYLSFYSMTKDLRMDAQYQQAFPQYKSFF